MTFRIRTRGASSQPILQDFLCADCGPISALAPRDTDHIPCPDCGGPAEWRISAPPGFCSGVGVIRGGVAQPDSPMYLSTRELGEGMPYAEWRAKRDKIYEERRFREAKEWASSVKGVA